MPAAPGGPTATAVGSGKLTVVWDPPAHDGGSSIEGYKVQWKSGSQDYDSSGREATLGPEAWLHTIDGLTNDVEYSVRVVAYNQNGDGAAAEAAGTPAAVEAIAPELSTATVTGATLVLNYDEALDEASEPGASAFAVQAGAASRGVTQVAVSGNTVTLALASAVISSDGVTVRYVVPEGPGAKPIRDVSGNNAVPLLGRTVRNDTITEVISIAITSDPGPDQTYILGSSGEPDVIEVTVTFSESVTVTGAPALPLDAGKPLPEYDVSSGPVLVFQSPHRAAEYHGGSGTAALTFRYTVSEGDNKPDGVSVPYPYYPIQLRGGTIRDGANNDAVLTHSGLAAQPGHKVDGARPAPIAGGAVVSGTTLTLTFDEPLAEDSVPTPGYGFSVTGRTVTGIWVDGTVVTLALNLPVSPGDEVNVGYTVPYYRFSDAIRDAVGNLAGNFYDHAVTVLTDDTMAPRATRVELLGASGHSLTYIIGESFDVTVTFNESVTVDATNGSPSLGLNVGDVVKQAVYHSGTGTAVLTFRYTVEENDEDTDGVEPGDMVANGGTIRDGSGNDAVLTLPEQGTRHPIKVDGVRPTLTATNGATAAGAGHYLLLNWSERLHGSSEPAAGAFTLAGGAVSRSVADVQKVGLSQLKLIITPPIEHGETGITLAYAVPTGPDASPIRDLYGNAAAAFSGQAVADIAQPALLPRNLVVAPVDGREGVLQVSWDAPLDDGGSAITAYRVYWRSEYSGISSGATVTDLANLTYTITGLFDGIPYRVRVRAINGVGGGAWSSRIATPGDRVRPELSAAVVAGETLTLTWSEALDEGSEPAAEAFAVSVAGVARGVTEVSVAGSTVALTLASAVAADDVVTVSYSVPAAPAAPRIEDTAGNDAAAFSGEAATNNTAAPVNTPPTGLPTISGTARVGETLTASETGIDDADGLTGVAFAWQWVSNDGTADTDIAGATATSYTLAAADAGRTIKVRVTFTDDGGTAETLTSAATAAVEDSLTLSVSDGSATEGALVEFTVSLSAASSQQVTVQYATSGVTAESETDFTAASGMLTFAANETSKTVSVATTADSADEENETFTLTLSSPTNATLGDATATGTINDDEPEDTVSPTVSVQCVDLEANPLGPQVSGNHSLSWELHFSELVTNADDTSARPFEIAGQDDTDFSWLAIRGLAGSHLHYRYFTTPVVSLENRGAVSDVNGVVITVPAGGWQDRSGNLNTASANSLYLAHNWKISVADASATEGTDGTIDFEVTLNARDDCETVTVDWATADGSATAGEDYTAANGTLTFGPGETSKTLSVVILDDTVEDSGETFTLQLNNASGATLADAEATGTISDKELPFVSVPQIDGVPQVGNTLEMSFAEPPSGALAYQWLRGSEVIAGATASTYVPTVADVGARLSVRVERGGETLASAATAPVWPAPANPPLADGEEELLSVTVTLGSHQFPYWVAGYGRVLGESFGEMDVTSFEDGGAIYVIDAFLVNSRGVFGLATGSTVPDASGLVAYWNGYRISGLEADTVKRGKLPMLVGHTPQPSTEYSRYEDGASDGVRVAVSLRRATNNTSDSVNTPPTGLPTISGTARVGETLTASETGIADVDGLSGATFAWQWIANDGSTDAEIAGATGATYALIASEVGKTVKVQVTFTDDGGTQETLVSAATGQVSAALTARFENVPERHDGATAFAVRIAFSEAVTTGVAALRDHAVEVTGGAVTGARRIDGRSDLWELSVEPGSDAEVTLALPADRACDAAGALCTADGGRLSNRPEATVAGPLPEISIAAAASPVAEGTAAAFTLSRSGDTAAALTVAVVVAEDGAALKVAPPENVTFGAGAGTAELAVATDDDERAESASTVTARLEGGDGYAVAADAASASVVVADDDSAPVVTTATPIAAPENGTTVATLVATDTDTPAANLAWSIAGGADADKFTLTAAGVLAFKAAPDFEAPDDAGADGEYEVTVTVTDGANPVEAELTVRLTDVDDVAPVLSSATVDGATVTLTFNEVLDESSVPPAGAFAVTVGTASRGVSGVSVDGSATVLTLASAVAADDTVAVTYTVPAEASVRIRDSAGNAAAGFSRQAVTNATPVANTLPAGQPAIAGTPLVGATLTASADGIEDADGLAGAVFAWQWIVNDGSGDADIAGATEASYTLTAAEAGKTVKVRVSFTDDGGTEETLLSAATASPVTEGDAAVFVLRRSGDTAAPLTVTVSVTEAGDVLDGAAPSSVTFAENAAEARLRIATEDDAAAEADARVTATVAAGAGYRVAAAAAAAGVDVFDDEQAPSSAAVTLWSGELEVGTYGGWIGALGNAVDDNGWAEDGVDYALDYVIYVPGELLIGFTRAPEEIDGLTLHFGEVELALADAGSGTTYAWSVELDWEPGMTVAVRLSRQSAAPAGPDVSVADATVREAAGAALRFRVTLEQPQATAVSVRYASADGTAVAGADYLAVRGALRFEPGETTKTVAVAVLDDAHEEGVETLTVTLSRLFGARLSDAEATGTIENADPLPRAWLARFGRTAAEQVLSAVEERLRASQSAGAQVTLAGHRVPSAPTAADPAALDAAAERQLAAWLSGDTAATGSRILTARELLSESAFQVGAPTAAGGTLTLWGGGAFSRFGGRDGAVELDGDVWAGLLGADYAHGGWLAGLVLGYHESGGGSYRSPAADGALHSWLVGGYPYVGYAAGPLALWGAAGYGQGKLTLTASGDAPLETGIRLLLGAGGARGELLAPDSAGGAGLAVNVDALVLRTSLEATPGLAAAEADVSRLRLGLEGSYALALGSGGRLTPTAELAVRHDGGHAETGFGLDLSGSLRWTAPALGLAAQVSGHGLLVHEAGFADWGVAGSLSYDPDPASDLGLSLSLAPAWGGTATSGADALHSRPTMAGLTADAARADSGARITAEAAYGLPLFGAAGVGTPYLGLGLADGSRDYRRGYRFAVATGPGLTLSIEGTRHESTHGADPQHTISLQGTRSW